MGGKAVLLISAEQAGPTLQELSHLPITDRTGEFVSTAQQVGAVELAVSKVPKDVKQKAYLAWLGQMKGEAGKLGWSKEELVRQANSMARDVLGWPGSPPEIESRLLGKMGLKNVDGLNIISGKSAARGRSPSPQSAGSLKYGDVRNRNSEQGWRTSPERDQAQDRRRARGQASGSRSPQRERPTSSQRERPTSPQRERPTSPQRERPAFIKSSRPVVKTASPQRKFI